MKKRLLFVMNNLKVGGAEKSLVSLLQTIDYDHYEVDLFLFEHEGAFLGSVPAQVNLLPPPENYQYFEMPVGKAVIDLLKRGKIGLALARLRFGFIYKTVKIDSQREQRSWPFLAKAFPKIDKHYDAVIGYLEKRPNYFAIDKVTAQRRIGFIHTDYDKFQMLREIDLPYFRKFDRIFTISEQCEAILKKNFPSIADKFEVMYNIVSPSVLRRLAGEQIDFPKKGITIVSVGRLNIHKGFDIAVDAMQILVGRGLDAYWYVLGDGEERAAIERKIEDAGLKDRFVLLGLCQNPYPYVAAADIYVQPSRFEGKSIAIDEAKILGKPIVVTNFPSVVDQIAHAENGWIVETNPEPIASGIMTLIDENDIRETLRRNLALENLGTEREIDKLYSVINNR